MRHITNLKEKKRKHRDALASELGRVYGQDAASHSPAAEALFSALKTLRLQLAKSQNLPPYVIFHDKTLRELAARQPTSLDALKDVSGVGERKAERYGELFLRAIAEHNAHAA